MAVGSCKKANRCHNRRNLFGRTAREEKNKKQTAKEPLGGENSLKNFIKTVLYAYPFIKTVEEDYETHIKNKALLSYDSRMTAEALAEYLAEEIIEMRRLEWLKSKLESVVERLSEEEKILTAGRYFGKRKKLREYLNEKEISCGRGDSERNYFRRQNRLEKKLEKMLIGAGITEEYYFSKLHNVETLSRIYKALQRAEEKKKGQENSSSRS